MSKQTLYADTVLRKDGDQLYLMNKQEGGFRSWATPIESEQWLVDNYHVRLGEWSRDEHGAFCPVICIPRSEQPTLHDTPPLKLHDFGPRGVAPALEHSTIAPFLREGFTEEEAIKALMGGHVRAHVVSDDVSQEGLRKLLGEIGPRGPVVIGVGGDLREYRCPGSDGKVVKVRMDSGTPEAFDRMMASNGYTPVDDGFGAMDEFGFGTRLLDALPRDPEAFAVKLKAPSPELRAWIDRMMSQKGLELVPYAVNGEVVRRDSLDEIRERALGELSRAQALGLVLYEDGALSEDKCFHGAGISDGLKQFIEAHPGVRVGMGPGPFLVAIMPDGTAVAVDQDGTVISEDELGS